MSRGLRSGIAGVAVAGAVAGAIVLGGASAEIAPLSPTGRYLQRMTAANMASHAYTEAEAVDMARRFDVISANKGQFRPYVAEMKAANPRLTLLVYLNGTFSHGPTLYPDSWYLRDANGNKVTSNGWGNYLMNPTNPGWLDSRAAECESFRIESGYDGCFIDMLGTAPLVPGYLTSLPINPATGQVWTEADWVRATTNVAAAIKARAGDHPVMGNGLGNGDRYFDAAAPTSALLGPEDSALAEAWLRAGSWAIDKFKTETSWKRDVDLLVDAGRRGKPASVMTKILVSGTTEQKDRWHKYALASFLMGTDGQSYFSFLRENTPWVSHPWDFVDVGTPTAPYLKLAGVYQRTFTKGLVLVNPTTLPVSLALPAPFKTLNGTLVSTITLAANTGEVLVSTLTSTTTTTAAPATTTTLAPTTTVAPTTSTTVAPTTTTIAPAGVVPSLTLSGYKDKGVHHVQVAWANVPDGSVEVVRDGSAVAATANDGAFLDVTQNRGGATYRYRVCNPGRTVCTPERTISF